MKALREDFSRIMNPIYFDRMIAREHLLQFTLIILIVPLFLLFLWLIGSVMNFGLDYFGVNCSTGDTWRNNIVWDTLENYINANSHPDSTFSHRVYMMFVGIIGAMLLNGIFISAIVSWVEKRSERWRLGDLHYDKMRWFQKFHVLNNHVVIIGGNEMVPDLILQLFKHESDAPEYVLLMTNRDVPSLRNKLSSELGEEYERQVVIYHGDRTIENDLLHLQIELAKSIYVIGEQLDIDQKGSHHDVKNMECVRLLSMILRKKHEMSEGRQTNVSTKLCRVMFEYQSTFSAFQFTDVNSEISDYLDFRPFNYYETWAQKVFVRSTLTPKESDDYLPLEGLTPITPDSSDTVHLIIVGMSRMGIALGLEAAQVAHYPNFIHNPAANLRTRITFIDTAAKQEMQYVQGHYKELFALSRWRFIEAGDDNIYYNERGHIPYDVNDSAWKDPMSDVKSHSPYRDNIENDYTLGKQIVDVDWEFIQGNLEMPTVQCYIRDAAKQKNVRLTIAICFPKDNQSYAGSLYLPDEVYEMNNNVVQVLAYQPFGDAMRQCFMRRIEMVGDGDVSSVQYTDFNLFDKFRAFGMMNSCYDINYQEKTEKAAGKLGLQYKNTNKDIYDYKSEYGAKLGIKSPLKAGKSLAAQQWSNTYAAAHLWTKLRSIEWEEGKEISSDTMSILAQTEHIRWNMEQLLMGYAPLKPKEQQSIKNILKQFEVPYDELELLSKSKDEEINPTQFPKVKKWLEAWKVFDERKAILKAKMSHLDICSYEELQELDPEAFKYDMNLTKVLPEIYTEIKKINK